MSPLRGFSIAFVHLTTGLHPWLQHAVPSGLTCSRSTAGWHSVALALPVFLHATPQAYVEMHWALAGLCCMGVYSIDKLKRAGIDPCQLSFSKAIRAFQRMMRDYLHPQSNDCNLDLLLRDAIKDGYQRGDRTSRGYPQKKKEKPPGTKNHRRNKATTRDGSAN